MAAKGSHKNLMTTIIIAFQFFVHMHGEQIEDVQRVLDNIFTDPGYNKMIRGVKDQTKSVDVNVTFSILSIDSLNEVDETLQLMGVLYIRWRDERLVWDPADYNNTAMVHIYQNSVWKPEIILANSARKVSLLGHERVMTTHYSNGLAEWNVGGLFKFYCTLDVTAYPWDSQTCTIRFMVWGYISKEVKLSTPSDVIRHSFHGSGAWELVSARTMDNSKESRIPVVLFTFELRRYSLFAVVNDFIPILTLTVLNSLAYFIPAASGERLSYCITVLLAFAVFLSIVSEHLPKNSSNMASLCYFLMSVLLMSTIICASSVLSISLYHKSEQSTPPRWLRKLAHKRFCWKNAKSKKENENIVKKFQSVKFEAFKDMEKNSVDGFVEKYDDITWMGLSSFVNKLSFWITIVLMAFSFLMFAIFILLH